MKAGYFFTDFPLITQHNGIKALKCTSFILIDNKYGPMIFDTGSAYDNENFINSIKQHFNLTPLDFNWVFISHIHPDHVGANRFFKNAKIVMSKKDYDFANKIAQVVFNGGNLLQYLHANCPGYITSFAQFEADNMQKSIEEFWSDEAIGMDLNPVFIEDNPDIPEFITIIPTFGHTFYHYSFKLQINDINMIFAGDALSMRMILRDENDDRMTEPHMEFESYFKSLEIFKKFNGLIIPGHDRPFYTENLKSIRKNVFFVNEIKSCVGKL